MSYGTELVSGFISGNGRKCRQPSQHGKCVKRDGHDSNHKDDKGYVFVVRRGAVKILWRAGDPYRKTYA